MRSAIPSICRRVGSFLGIRPRSADLYMAFLAHDTLSPTEVQQLFGLPEQEVKLHLQELVGKGLIQSIQENGSGSVYQAVSLVGMADRFTKNPALLTTLESFLPTTVRLAPQLGIVKYEGLDGIRRAYLEILEEAKKCGEPILAFEKGVDAQTLGIPFIDRYIRKRLQAKVEAYIISPSENADKEYKQKYEGPLTHVKIVPSIDIHANINIVGDLVMSFDLDPAQGTLRKDRSEAQTFKAIFRELWTRED